MMHYQSFTARLLRQRPKASGMTQLVDQLVRDFANVSVMTEEDDRDRELPPKKRRLLRFESAAGEDDTDDTEKLKGLMMIRKGKRMPVDCSDDALPKFNCKIAETEPKTSGMTKLVKGSMALKEKPRSEMDISKGCSSKQQPDDNGLRFKEELKADSMDCGKLREDEILEEGDASSSFGDNVSS